MSFIQKSISEDETIYAEVSLSLWGQLPLIIMAFVSIISVYWIGFLGFGGLVFLGIAYINLNSYEFAVTNRKILSREGFFSWNTTDLPLSKVETIDVNQSLLGRMLNYGDIIVTGTGGNKESVKCVDNPFEFRKSAMEALEHRSKTSAF